MAQVPLVRKLAFTASGFGNAACLAAINIYLMYFYTDVALLGVGLAGLAKGIGRIFDAINDPIVGYFSDKTHTRWGRRRPWMATAALPFALSFVLLFRPPATTDQYTLFVYFLVTSMALDIFLTMLQIPGFALATELSSDYQERTQIFAFHTFFNNIGTICGGFLPLAVAHFADARTGYAQVTVLFALVAAPVTLLALFAPERRDALRGAAAGLGDFWRGYRACLRNRAFRTLLVTFAVMSLGGGIGQSVAVYALVYWLGFTRSEIGLLIPVYLGASCLALPFWTWLSGRIGKDVALKRLLFYEMFVLGTVYFLIPSKPLIYAFMVAAGFGLAGFVTVTSLLADILDTDELDSGVQRAGIFLSFWTLVTKGAMAAGPVVVGWILALAGYVPNVQQTPIVIETLRCLYGPVPGLFFITGYFLFRKFSLTRERLNEIQVELARRRVSAAATRKVG
ncbi:MAG TPA: glycoside-pentoside-hexuronide (GPH):cation symporter [Candidatus Binatia bacterium]|nr:glycoside-pentoside-hexuronide (GPH):cation symporter [Candidatus Binatia bacterium]